MKEKLIKDVHNAKKIVFNVNLFTDDNFNEEITSILYCVGEILETAEKMMRKEIEK